MATINENVEAPMLMADEEKGELPRIAPVSRRWVTVAALGMGVALGVVGTIAKLGGVSSAMSSATDLGKVTSLSRVDSQKQLSDAFNNVYKTESWGHNLGSGPGSIPARNAGYMAILQSFLKLNNITSVVDVGCGDWQFSHLLNWTGMTYTGIDVATTVIDADNKKYAMSDTKTHTSISFQVGSATKLLPKADMLIIKDVLQHIPNADVKAVLETNIFSGRFKYAFITNDVEDGVPNKDIARPGLYRRIDLTAAPFSVSNLTEIYRFAWQPGNEGNVQRTYLYKSKP